MAGRGRSGGKNGSGSKREKRSGFGSLLESDELVLHGLQLGGELVDLLDVLLLSVFKPFLRLGG